MFFAFTVATSIGYGTFAPKTPAGRGFTILYALVAIPLMLMAFTNLCDVLLGKLANGLAGQKADLPVKVRRGVQVRIWAINVGARFPRFSWLRTVKKMQAKRPQAAPTPRMRHVPQVFRMIDSDRSGTLDRKEVLRALRLMGLNGYSGENSAEQKRRHFDLAFKE